MHATRVFLTALIAATVAAMLSACSLAAAPAPRPTVTVTVNPTPSAAAQAEGWLGEESIGASMYYIVFMSWVDQNGTLTGQLQGAYPSDGSGPAVTVANASLTGEQAGNTITVQASAGGSVFGWSGSATGSVTSSALNLEGGMLSSFLPSAYMPEGAPQLTLQPATAADFETAIGHLDSIIVAEKQANEQGCPNVGCSG